MCSVNQPSIGMCGAGPPDLHPSREWDPWQQEVVTQLRTRVTVLSKTQLQGNGPKAARKAVPVWKPTGRERRTQATPLWPPGPRRDRDHHPCLPSAWRELITVIFKATPASTFHGSITLSKSKAL